jgi:VWFA-related protein
MLLLLCLGSLVLLAGLPGAAAAQSPAAVRVTQVDTSKYPEVSIYVAVLDAAGQPRHGLSQHDFTLTEDGTPVDITAFNDGGGQINTALVIDQSGSMREVGKLRGAQEAARTFVAQMRANDQTTLLAFNHASHPLHDLTGSQERLTSAIGRLYANGGTAFYDAIIVGVDALRGVGGRRVLLVLTDGQDCRDTRPDVCPSYYGSDASLDEAIAYANQHEQPVYVVGLGDRSSATNSDAGINEAVLQRIASESYGEYFYAPDAGQLAALYSRLAGNLQAEYQLTYISPRPAYDGTRRDIQVSVGALTSGGAYTERHLINVHSSPLVGLLLLLPLVGLLLLPSVLRRGGPGTAASAPAESPLTIAIDDEEEADTPTLPTGSAASTAPRTALLPETEAAHRAPASVAAGPNFCHQCGSKLRPGAHFCGNCGTKAGV